MSRDLKRALFWKLAAPLERHAEFGIVVKVINLASKKYPPPTKKVARYHGNADHVTCV